MSDETTVFVQWKGTEVCRVYDMPHTFTLTEVADGGWTSTQEPEPWMEHPPRDGPDVVEVHAPEPE